jgi:hypothetical protein
MYFSTDVIVGFPGETEEDFAQTRELFEACNYDMAYIFKYSIRTGTPAADMGDQMPEEVKEARNQDLLNLLQGQLRPPQRHCCSARWRRCWWRARTRPAARFTGRTRGNRVCVFDADPRLIGELVPLKIERASVSTCFMGRWRWRGWILIFLFPLSLSLSPMTMPAHSITKNSGLSGSPCGLWPGSGPSLKRLPAKLAAKDQLDRASTSIVLNLAEGNGKRSHPDRCRYFDIARGSALECAACLDVLGTEGTV